MTNPVIEAIKARRSIRFYEDKPVPPELIDTLLECAQLSPSGLGLQAWHFTVIRDRAFLDEISEANKKFMMDSGNPDEIAKASEPGFHMFRGAPMAIIVSGELSSPFHTADCANAMTTMALTAQSLGLSTCYIAGFRKVLRVEAGKELVERLGLPEGYEAEFALAVGYGAKEPNPRKPRKENAVNYIG